MFIKNDHGISLLEVLLTVVIISILATIVTPLAKVSSQRAKEQALRERLRELRQAIDRFHEDWAREGNIVTGLMCAKNKTTCKEHTGETGYPKSLDDLVTLAFAEEDAIEKATENIGKPFNGHNPMGETLENSSAASEKRKPKKHYVRRIPTDPLTGMTAWGLRCSTDPPEAVRWCKEDVFDVYSLSTAHAMDQTKYRDW